MRWLILVGVRQIIRHPHAPADGVDRAIGITRIDLHIANPMPERRFGLAPAQPRRRRAIANALCLEALPALPAVGAAVNIVAAVPPAECSGENGLRMMRVDTDAPVSELSLRGRLLGSDVGPFPGAGVELPHGAVGHRVGASVIAIADIKHPVRCKRSMIRTKP